MSKEEVKVSNEVKKEKEVKKKRANKVLWRIKCVKSFNDHFTVGKTYPVYRITHKNGIAYFKTINDTKHNIYISLSGKKYGVFELVINE